MSAKNAPHPIGKSPSLGSVPRRGAIGCRSWPAYIHPTFLAENLGSELSDLPITGTRLERLRNKVLDSRVVSPWQSVVRADISWPITAASVVFRDSPGKWDRRGEEKGDKRKDIARCEM